MNSPLVPISWGELFDKITILQIKLDKSHLKRRISIMLIREFKQLQIHFNKIFPKEH